MLESSSKLDADTERALLDRWCSDRDASARDRLVTAHQRFVARVAKRYAKSAQHAADLIQEGNLGLLHALDRFEPERGVRLATYAAWWVRAYVLRYVEKNRGLVRGATTTNRSRVFYQLERTRRRLAADGEDVSREAIAFALGVDVKDVAAVESLRSTTSLDAKVTSSEGEGASRLDLVADEGPSPEELVEADEMRQTLSRALTSFQDTLQGKHLEMFRERVVSPRPRSLVEFADRWGLARSAVRRIETGVERPLRRHLLRTMGDSITLTLGPA